MRFLSLLPFGRQFTPVDRQSGRYQRAEEGLLPDFSANRSPAGAPKSQPQLRKGGEAWVAPSKKAPAAPTASPFQAVQPMEARFPLPILTQPSSHRRRLPVWLEQLLLGLLRPGNRRRGSREVQTELCFQSVTPARNDLITADIEVVSARRPGGPNCLSPACRQRILRLWWEQGTRRIRRLGGLWP